MSKNDRKISFSKWFFSCLCLGKFLWFLQYFNHFFNRSLYTYIAKDTSILDVTSEKDHDSLKAWRYCQHFFFYNMYMISYTDTHILGDTMLIHHDHERRLQNAPIWSRETNHAGLKWMAARLLHQQFQFTSTFEASCMLLPSSISLFHHSVWEPALSFRALWWVSIIK